MAELIIGVVVVLSAGAVWWISERHARRRAKYLAGELSGWDDWDAVERVVACRKSIVRLVEDVAALRRAFLLFSIAVAAAGTWAVLSIQDTSDQTEGVVHELRGTTCTFFRLQDADLTDQIRQRQVRRDATAEEVIVLQEGAAAAPDLEDLPSFSAMPESVQAFIRPLAAAEVVDAQTAIEDALRRLAVHDEDLVRLRAQVDEVRALAASSGCP
jgi:hypothetical protein